MVLVQRVFKISLLFLFLSCETIEKNHNTQINKTIYIQKNKIILENEKAKDEIKTTLLPAIITNGSISTIAKLENDLWIGKLGGSLLRYNLFTEDSKTFTEDTYTIKDYSIKKIIENKDYVFALQSDRVISINKHNQKVSFTNFPVDINRASDIVLYKNKAYISTLGYGVREYIPEENTFTQLINNLNFVSSLYIYNDILYIGSMNNGLYEYDLINNTLLSRFNYPISLFNKNILEINKIKNILLLGSAKNGLIKWNMDKNSIETIYENESVSSIFVDKTDIFAVSFIGLGVYLEKNNLNILESIHTNLVTNNITSIVIFNNNLISGNIKKGLIKQENLFLNE